MMRVVYQGQVNLPFLGSKTAAINLLTHPPGGLSLDASSGAKPPGGLPAFELSFIKARTPGSLLVNNRRAPKAKPIVPILCSLILSHRNFPKEYPILPLLIFIPRGEMEHSTIAALACLLVPGRVIEKAHIYIAAHDFYAVKSRFQGSITPEIETDPTDAATLAAVFR